MKTAILIIALLGFITTQETDECYAWFHGNLEEKCTSNGLTECKYNIFDKKCLPTNSCAEGNGDPDLCKKLIHPDFHLKKCKYDEEKNECKEALKTCTDYNKANPDASSGGVTIKGDVCEQLAPGDEGDRCFLSSSCLPQFNKCQDALIDPATKCTGNIPLDHSKLCKLNDERTGCTDGDTRRCNSSFKNIDKDACSKLTVIIKEDGKCIYKDQYCVEVYPKCEDYYTHLSSCSSSRIPWDESKNDYNYYYKCSLNTVDGVRKCEEERRNCTEYSGDDESICTSLRAKDPNKRCAFDATRSQKCYEEYKSCQIYNDTVPNKTGTACRNIKLLEPNRKCVYIEEEDKCEETLNYTTCEEYTGTDKTTCESIISPTTHSKCVLEKDSECKEKERELLCKEAFNEEDCIYYAKPRESGKRCVWSGSCYEVYTRCEDYTENNITTTTCPNLYLYNGQRCYSDLGRCRSIQKTCSDARNADECKLIAKTGVSDPDKKVCSYISGNCVEVFKYCSDYRGTVQAECKKITPYDKSGNYTDPASQCEIKSSSIGCEKVTKACNVANGNPILCEKISKKIKNNNIKYCAYVNNQCTEQYKNCEDIVVNDVTTDSDACTDNYPESYFTTGKCIIKDDKCATSESCNTISVYSDLKYFCEGNPNCSYIYTSSIGYTCNKTEKACSSIKFYTESEENEALCQSIEVENPNKICSLNSDKSGCEEKLKDSSFSYSSPNTGGSGSSNSSELLAKRIELIIILLSLLL